MDCRKPYHHIPLCMLLLLACACSGPPQQPLRVGTNIWPGYESLYLAQDLDYFPQGSIHLAELPSTTAVLHELGAGTLDAACLTLDEALAIHARGLDIRILLVMDVSSGGDALLVHPLLGSPEKLRGRIIAVENTAVGAVLLDSALQALGLQHADVTLRYASVDEHEELFVSGEVDAVVTFEPVRSRLLAAGALQVFDSGQIPKRIVNVLVAPRAITETRARQLRTLVNGYFHALDYRRRHPIDAGRRMAPRLGVHPDDVTALFDGIAIPDLAENRRLLLGAVPALHETALQLFAAMEQTGLLPGPVNIQGMIQPRFLPTEEI